jgi:hypothetical protein
LVGALARTLALLLARALLLLLLLRALLILVWLLALLTLLIMLTLLILLILLVRLVGLLLHCWLLCMDTPAERGAREKCGTDPQQVASKWCAPHALIRQGDG